MKCSGCYADNPSWQTVCSSCGQPTLAIQLCPGGRVLPPGAAKCLDCPAQWPEVDDFDGEPLLRGLLRAETGADSVRGRNPYCSLHGASGQPGTDFGPHRGRRTRADTRPANRGLRFQGPGSAWWYPVLCRAGGNRTNSPVPGSHTPICPRIDASWFPGWPFGWNCSRFPTGPNPGGDGLGGRSGSSLRLGIDFDSSAWSNRPAREEYCSEGCRPCPRDSCWLPARCCSCRGFHSPLRFSPGPAEWTDPTSSQ